MAAQLKVMQPHLPPVALTAQPVSRCPHGLSTRLERKDLGCTCPSCLEMWSADRPPVHWQTIPHPFPHSQGMGVPLKLLAESAARAG